jgi:hypothetical protein
MAYALNLIIFAYHHEYGRAPMVLQIVWAQQHQEYWNILAGQEIVEVDSFLIGN